ncbi:MAG: hypothetical protein IIC60_12605 [Proteobacteria bacterium]|nr:hypothetical protein [Pseudomonadota bacterium]
MLLQSKTNNSPLLTLLFILITTGYSSAVMADCASQTDIPQVQCETLVDFYNSTNGTSWTDNNNWLDDSPCGWSGITCENGSVTRLNVADNGLAGEVPALGALSALTNLNLNFNQLTGPLPDISGLTQLSSADFFDNQFSGSIPELNNLPNLSYLNLGFNSLSGVIPSSLVLLPLLSKFFINGNSVTAVLYEDYLNLTLSAFHFDNSSVCVVSKQVADWLDAIENLSGSFNYCWSLTAALGDEQLGKDDILLLLARINNLQMDANLGMDLFLSLVLPDQQTEAFLVLRDGVIGAVIANTDPVSWVPIVSDFQLTPGFDTGLISVFEYQLTGTEPVGTYIWKIRATRPGTTELLHEAQSSFYFNPALTGIEISAPAQAVSGSTVSFQMRFQSVNATHALNLSAGVSNSNVSRGRSLS